MAICKTKLEAAQRWVSQMNAVDTNMIARLMDDYPEEWEEVTCEEYPGRIYERLPMWGTMWSFESIDNYWLDKADGIKKMSRCGFRIYYHEEWGYFFGIDGGGYNFYEAHWLPLYEARGLQWHEDGE